MVEWLNRLLDGLSRARIGDRSAFLVAGTAGFYGAVAVIAAAGLVTGLPLMVLVLLSAVSVASFFAYMHVRKLITGAEQMVQQHQVWLALLASAGALVLLEQPVLPFLDILSAGLAVFLAFGRLGCLMVGCCHGRPSRLGIRYGQDHAHDGFPRHLVGVRLFPVQGLELIGFAGIALTSIVALPVTRPGSVLCWFLFAHGLLRFAVDPLRWDSRSDVMGLSRARWRSVFQLVVAVALADRGIDNREAIGSVILAGGLVGVLGQRITRDPRRRALSALHLEEMRALANVAGVEALTAAPGASPATRTSSAGVSIAASAHPHGHGDRIHFSLAMPRGMRDLRLLCDLASEALPGLRPEHACASQRGVLHLLLESTETSNGPPRDHRALADRLYASVLSPAPEPDPAGQSRRDAQGPAYFAPARIAP